MDNIADNHLSDNQYQSGSTSMMADKTGNTNDSVWDTDNMTSTSFNEIYGIGEGDDGLPFEGLLGQEKVEKSILENWIPSGVVTSNGLQSPKDLFVRLSLPPHQMLSGCVVLPEQGLINNQGLISFGQSSGLGPNSLITLEPNRTVVRPNDQVAMNAYINAAPAPQNVGNQNQAIMSNDGIRKICINSNNQGNNPPQQIMLIGQNRLTGLTNQNHPAIMIGHQQQIRLANPTTSDAGMAMKAADDQANLRSKSSRNNRQSSRSKMDSVKPAMNEKDIHELERVMDILKHYKQQVASNDQVSQFLPCKRKRSKPESSSVTKTSGSDSSEKSAPSKWQNKLDHIIVNTQQTLIPTGTNNIIAPILNKPPLGMNLCSPVISTIANWQRSDVVDGGGTSCSNHNQMSKLSIACSTGIHVSGSVMQNLGSGISMSGLTFSNSLMTPVSCSISAVSSAPMRNETVADPVGHCTQNSLPDVNRGGHVENKNDGVYNMNVELAGQRDTVDHNQISTQADEPVAAFNQLETVNNDQINSNMEQNEVGDVEAGEVKEFEPGSEMKDSSLTETLVAEESMSVDQSLKEQIRSNCIEKVPSCECKAGVHDESKDGPYYTQLGAAQSVAGIRELMEKRFGLKENAVRIEKIIYTGKEGKSVIGCPIAKWIIRRSNSDEKVLCLVRKRNGHRCETAVLVVGIVVWDGVELSVADAMYDCLTSILPQYGLDTERRCGSNERKTCACQGWDQATAGASFTFGCSWSMFYNSCKFAKSPTPRKFRLKNQQKESTLAEQFESLATDVAPLYAKAAPDSYKNQTLFESEASDCRLGRPSSDICRPWSGVTAVVDYSTHSHKDINNMHSGCTAVVTLTKHRDVNERPDDEQLHVLPLYILDSTDEHDSVENQRAKIAAGAVECLTKFPLTMRIHREKVARRQRNSYRKSTKPRGKKSQEEAGKTGGKAASTVLKSPGGSTSKTEGKSAPTGDCSPEVIRTINSTSTANQQIGPENQLMSNVGAKNDGVSPCTSAVQGTFVAQSPGVMQGSIMPQGACMPQGMCMPQVACMPKACVIPQNAGMPQDAGMPHDTGMPQDPGMPHMPQDAGMPLAVGMPQAAGVPLDTCMPQGTCLPEENGIPEGAEMPQGSGMPQGSFLQQDSSLLQPQAACMPQGAFVPQGGCEPESLSHGLDNNSRPNAEYEFQQQIPHCASQPTAGDKECGGAMSGQPETFPVIHDLLPLQNPSQRQSGEQSVQPSNPEVIEKDSRVGNSEVDEQIQPPLNWHTEIRKVVVNGGEWGDSGGEPMTSTEGNCNLFEKGDTAKNSENVSELASSDDAAVLVSTVNKTMSALENEAETEAYSSPQMTHDVGFVGQRRTGGFLDLLNRTADDDDDEYLDTPLDNIYDQPHVSHTPASDTSHWMEDGEGFHRSESDPDFQQSLSNPSDFSENQTEASRPEKEEVYTENEHCFRDENIGGVALALTHGSVFFEVAKREVHATTALKKPNLGDPTRIGLIFYQHKTLHYSQHGRNVLKTEGTDQCSANVNSGTEKPTVQKRKLDSSASEAIGNKRRTKKADSLWDMATVNSVYTMTTDTLVTKWIKPKLATSGPYQCWG